MDKIKVNGKVFDISLDDPIINEKIEDDHWIESTIKGEYYLTEEYKKSIYKRLLKTGRYVKSPYWKLYYSITSSAKRITEDFRIFL